MASGAGLSHVKSPLTITLKPVLYFTFRRRIDLVKVFCLHGKLAMQNRRILIICSLFGCNSCHVHVVKINDRRQSNEHL